MGYTWLTWPATRHFPLRTWSGFSASWKEWSTSTRPFGGERESSFSRGTWGTGSWAESFFAKEGLRTHVLTYDEDAPDLKEIKEGFRRGYGIETIVVGDSPLSSLPIIGALKEGGVVAMLVDRVQGEGTREVPFLGRPTLFPVGPVVLAGLTGAAIMPAFVVMEKRGTYRGIIPGLVDLPKTGDREADLAAALSEIARLFEA